MASTLVAPAELDQSARARGGLLSVALPPPEGWMRGIAVNFHGCGEPILRDKCIAAVDTPHRPGVAEFPAFPIEQSSTCSTLSDIDHEEHARDRLDATTEWALGRQLATDQAGTGAPSLEDATVLGTMDLLELATAVGCLEQAAADTGFGARWVLHAPVRAAAYLAERRLNIDGFTPSGQRWIFSPGYPSNIGTTMGLWATGVVWAAVSGVDVHSGTADFRRNSLDGWAMRTGIVAFDPCINLAIGVNVPACPIGTP